MKRKLLILTCVSVPIAAAQDAMESLSPLTVVGSVEGIYELSGSASFIDAVEFRQRGQTTFAQVVSRTPGVYVRSEDSFGNFINVSIRGVDGNRSNKVTLMEDGILTAPSPYSNPSAYYSPKVARMAGVEILKGSSQVRYGPQTTGGVINFLSTPIPEAGEPRFYSRNTYGSHNTFFNHLWYGDTAETAAGRFGWLLELHQQSSDGFRKTDGSGGNAGFDLVEPMVKLFWEPDTALNQRFEFKYGHTDFDSDDSYPGVTEQDLRRDYDRRYAVAGLDSFDSDATRTYLRWIAEPSDAIRIESTVYYNAFNRAFYRANDVRLGASNALGGGPNIPVAQALMNPAALAVLQGFGDGTVRRLSNIREHQAFGWQNQLNFRFDTGNAAHDLAAGLRVHHDDILAYGQDVRFRANGAGGFSEAARAPQKTKGILDEVTAVALYLEDEIRIDRLTLRPGIRYEFLEYQRTTAQGVKSSGDANLLMGGMGANYELDDCNSLFTGLYQGATPPNVGGYLNGAKAETSLGYELGYRHRRDNLRAEVVGFYTDFDNLITPTVGIETGSVVNDTNGGETLSYGVEALVEYDAGDLLGGAFGLPLHLSATYTRARFDLPTGTRLTDGVFAGAENRSEVPYVPEWKLAAGIGLTAEKWALFLDATYVTSTWASGWNGRTPSGPGTPAATHGKIDPLLLFDLSGNYQLNDHVKLVGGVHNLFDERALVSRHPQGPRGNAPRMLFAGAEFTF